MSYVRQRKRGKPFCERSKKRRSARKISRCARNDGRGYSALYETAEKGKAFAKGVRNDGVQERISRCAPHDGNAIKLSGRTFLAPHRGSCPEG